MPPPREWFEKDYYAVLGVKADATDKDITKAYRRLAKKYHPDANPGDSKAEERFKEISTAHDVLGDETKRKEYDEARRMASSGFNPFSGGGPGGPGGANFNFEDLSGFGGLGDVLGGLFGRGRGRGSAGAGPGMGASRGADLESELHLSFLDAIEGVTTSVRLTSEVPCSVCRGTGAAAGTRPRRCDMCGGSGAVARDQGPFSFSEVCGRCHGTGQMVDKPCERCRGRGVEVAPREVKVRIPAGVNDGQRIRIKGRGEPGARGGPTGDLYVIVHVADHPVFGRRGRNLTLRLPVTFAEAALGADVRVPTLDGSVTVRIPPGTSSGKTLRVKDKGVHGGNGKGGGDLLVTVDVLVPTTLSDEERSAVEALAKASSQDPRAHLGV